MILKISQKTCKIRPELQQRLEYHLLSAIIYFSEAKS